MHEPEKCEEKDRPEVLQVPGVEFEVDTMVTRVYLVHPRTGRIIGRVAVTLVVDRFSRLIIGCAMTVDVSRHTAVALALLNAATEKVGYGRELGLHVATGEWPSGRPDIVRLAPNSFDNDAQWAPIAGLGIAIQLGSPMPKRKSLVESAFQRWDDEVLKSLPGYGCGEHGHSESEGGPATAVRTLLPLRRFTVDWIIRYNTSHVLNRYPLTRHMVQDGVQPIPIKLWNWGVHNVGPVVIPDC